jgi:hypothetical protein
MLYKVIVGDDVFEHKYVTDTLSLLVLNNRASLDNEFNRQLFNSSDMAALRSGGGTVIYRRGNTFDYLIDLDHQRSQEKSELYDLFESIRASLKRDLKINMVL